MIYAIGLDTDQTFVSFLRRGQAAGATITAINLRAMAADPWQLAVPAGSGTSTAYDVESRVQLDPRAGYYVRMIDLTPALRWPETINWRQMMIALAAFLETVEGCVINRPGAHAHNGSKALHAAWLIAHGFDVPPSITSSRSDVLARFMDARGPCVVKALCGMRGIARTIERSELADFDPMRGPVHIQQAVRGDDVRAHVVGDEVIAERIVSDDIDYRAPDARTTHTPTQLPRELQERVVKATAELGLEFAGWDFKIDADGRYWCLEVNPMPGYDVYDRRADGAITTALLRRLGHPPHG